MNSTQIGWPDEADEVISGDLTAAASLKVSATESAGEMLAGHIRRPASRGRRDIWMIYVQAADRTMKPTQELAAPWPSSPPPGL